MSVNLKKFDTSRFGTFCSFMLPLILLLQLSLPGVALCLEQDGNVELETYANGTCYEKSSGTPAVIHLSEGISSEHCGSCIDIPTTDKNSEYKAVSSNDLTPEIDIHAFLVYELTPEVPLGTPGQVLLVQEILNYKSFLDSLHTTVITC